MAIPMFITGVIKYVERICILRAASWKQLSRSIFPTAGQASGQTTDQSTPGVLTKLEEHLDSKIVIKESRYIHKAFCMFKMSMPLFSDLKLRIPQKLSKIFILSSNSADDAFRLIEVELGFLYDVLYTKKTLRPQPILGTILHSICLLLTFTALIAFSIVVEKNGYPEVDIAITYTLFAGAIFLNICSAISKVRSNWTMLWLTDPSNWMSKFVPKGIVSWYLRRNLAKNQGIAYMAQHSLMDYCLKTKRSRWRKIVRFFDTEDILGKLVLTSWEKVNHEVRNFIHDHLVKRQSKYCRGGFQYKDLSSLLSKKRDGVLETHNLMDKFGWSATGLEFNHCLLIWHIATDLLFHVDLKRHSPAELGSHYQISKHLSDYMMYLLFVRPNMLPKGIGQLRMKETRKEVMGLFQNNVSLSSSEVVNTLLGLNFGVAVLLPQDPSRSKSVIAEGCQLAWMLRSLVEDSLWDHSAKWEFIADMWMEIMTFAASRCEWREHKIQLKNGGELLTHVALLMAHFGLAEHIEITTDEEDNSKLLRFDSTRLGWDWDQLSHLPYYLA
ncbi:hypothetical protein SLEP1_g21248 [Rubroshorea leprosula]|uniref:DUF4220 domain-containing protein n=1 Tax=Rubroshorea leprosula TaxID=152421 RepID=A0AAV5JBD7_9ROSI|nr:hypothetical protein SLEP1_g21248 [Rubroshorea leprosula]